MNVRNLKGSKLLGGVKKDKSKDLSFFIHCESNGISSRFSVYLITEGAYHQPKAVFSFRNDDIQSVPL